MSNQQKAADLSAPGTCSPLSHSWSLRLTSLTRLLALVFVLAWLPGASGQTQPSKVTDIKIQHVGPVSVSDSLIRANIRVRPGDPYFPAAVDDDVRNLYATGLFYNVRVSADPVPDGLTLTYIVQANPRLVEVKFQGNKKFTDSKLRKTISSKAGDPFNERKLFTDTQELQKLYQKKGYPRSEVKYSYTIDENTARATATFEIKESPKVKISAVDFVAAKAFTQRQLRHVIKTRKHWMFSWLTGSGYLKDEQFEEDQEKLRDYYRDHGYLDFEIKKVDYINPSPRRMIIRFEITEGTQYRVGSVKFSGYKLFSIGDITNGLRMVHAMKGDKAKTGPNGLTMDVGDIFSPKGLAKDSEDVEDVYGSKGYIDVTPPRGLGVIKIPNTESGTMDLNFEIDEGQKSYIEKIEIRGNTKTKDKVIRRELAVSPGEPFDMVRVKRSKLRLQGLQYFDKVDARPEPTDIPNHRDLIIGVDEKNTGNLTLGAGFSSVDALVGFVDITQGNFDLFRPPTFTGGGQRFRLHLAVGTLQQDYMATFVEPWFLGHKLQMTVDAFYRDLAYFSRDNMYDIIRAGGDVSFTRALGSDFLIGGISYKLEDVGVRLNSGFFGPSLATVPNPVPFGPGVPTFVPGNVPDDILHEVGYNLLSRVGALIAYDTRNSVQLPDKGQRTQLDAEWVTGDRRFYKFELKTDWFFRGFAKGHVLELTGRAGVVDSLESADTPFYERFYLGGLNTLRGFRFYSISPRQPGFDEPIGGDSYWFGTAEYSIPIIPEKQPGGMAVRFAVFYDIGNVAARPYSFSLNNFDDNWGIGLRLNLPIGPLRLDYGIPIHHDQFNSGSGQFQFGVGYTRGF
ncbi:MAG TPA: outer membrane protein assembly factor BamA [Candidatus Acidoferrum sp.]|jgi:outer membrane protein insertion porin family|nr:outer membrane protein assembly factor BamA [Candidatus Acidoferrum sp.]